MTTRSKSIYDLQKVSNTVVKWTSILSVCLLSFDVDRRIW